MTTTKAAPTVKVDLPEERVANMVKNVDEAQWKVPSGIANILPLGPFMFRVDREKGWPTVFQVEAALPLAALSPKEQARFAIKAESSRFFIRIREDDLISAVAEMQLHGLVIDPIDCLGILVGEYLAQLKQHHREPTPRPFITNWVEAIMQLTSVMCQMFWQRIAIESTRDIAFKAAAIARRDCRKASAGWSEDQAKGIGR